MSWHPLLFQRGWPVIFQRNFCGCGFTRPGSPPNDRLLIQFL